MKYCPKACDRSLLGFLRSCTLILLILFIDRFSKAEIPVIVIDSDGADGVVSHFVNFITDFWWPSLRRNSRIMLKRQKC